MPADHFAPEAIPTMLDLAQASLLSPAVLCFALGALAVWFRSDLRVPEPVFAGLSIFLMLSIGLRGGHELSEAHWAELAGPLLGGLALGCIIPLWSYALLRRFAGLSAADAGAMAAHYGSVSAVTFAALTALLDQQGVAYEGFAPALLAVMEVPAIVVGIGLARVTLASTAGVGAVTGGGAVVLGGMPSGSRTGWTALLNEIMSSKSIVLLVGGLAIGALAGPSGMAKVKPFFGDLFQGALCLFLLELGRVAASRVGEFYQLGLRLAAFALVMPVLHGALGVGLGYLLGMSQGGAVVLGTLAASASYIAAPAAVRLALPEANPGYYLTCSLAITFPFNIILGLALYQAMAALLYG
jgi:hypothetical protein